MKKQTGVNPAGPSLSLSSYHSNNCLYIGDLTLELMEKQTGVNPAGP